MFYRIAEFIRDNRDGIRIGLGILMMIGGLVVIILGHVLLGLLILGLGIVRLAATLNGILFTSGYAGEEALTPGMGGHGRNVSAKNKNTAPVASETTGAIWDQMTVSNNNDK